MQRLVVCLFVAFLGGFAIQANLNAQGAAAYFYRGNAWADKGEYDKAIDAYTEALAMNSKLTPAYNNRGRAWHDKGEYDKAIADYNQALAIKPKDADAYGCRGSAYLKKREYDKAIADFTEALAIKPNDADVCYSYSNRGEAWREKGENDKAIADYNQALAVNPNFDLAYNNRGIVWRAKGEYAKAIADYSHAAKLAPDDAHAYNNLAWLYATCHDEKYRDGKKAVENAKKAYDSDGGENWHCVGALAAAYAESGDFDKAEVWGAKAVELAKADKSASDDDKSEASTCLELYKQGKPCRK